MSFTLRLLADVRWRQRPVVGDRPQALLAALAVRGCRPVSAGELIELIWGDEPPVNGPKSPQVLVSRTRRSPENERPGPGAGRRPARRNR